MRVDEVAARNAVAVREDQVVARGGRDRLVQDLALAKATVLMPHVLEAQLACAFQPQDAKSGFRRRAVVGDDDLPAAGNSAPSNPTAPFQASRASCTSTRRPKCACRKPPSTSRATAADPRRAGEIAPSPWKISNRQRRQIEAILANRRRAHAAIASSLASDFRRACTGGGAQDRRRRWAAKEDGLPITMPRPPRLERSAGPVAARTGRSAQRNRDVRFRCCSHAGS